MATRFLNGGELENYHAIGEDGVLVWQKADSFLSSIQSSQTLGQKYAEFLALPRFTPDGSHVDWFIPFSSTNADGEYDVVSWNAASPEEKQHALAALDELNIKFLDHGYNLQARALTTNDKIFAHFLTGNNEENKVNPAIQYPDETCLFIVDGRPVITFWGFLNKGSKLLNSPFDRLHNVGALGAGAAGAAGAAQTAEAVTPVVRSHKWCLLGLLALLLLLPLLLYFLWWYFYARALPLFKVFPDVENSTLYPTHPGTLPIPDITGKDLGLSDLDIVYGDDFIRTHVADDTLLPTNEVVTPDDTTVVDPDNAAVVDPDNTAVVDPDNTAVVDPDNTAVTPPVLDDNTVNPDDLNNANDPLQNPTNTPATDGPALSNDDLSSNDISKLNGVWNVNSGVVDATTNKPVSIQYKFDKGNGQIIVTKDNGIKCVGNVQGGIANGSLKIHNESEAKCSDGTSYATPKVICTQGENGNSKCTSIYSGEKTLNKSEFPMTMHR